MIVERNLLLSSLSRSGGTDVIDGVELVVESQGTQLPPRPAAPAESLQALSTAKPKKVALVTKSRLPGTPELPQPTRNRKSWKPGIAS